MIRTWPVQQAIYSALTSDATLVGMISGVMDEPDQNQAYPFIVLGEETGSADDILDITGAQQTLTLHFWDKFAPISRVKQIMDRTALVLHNRTLTMTGTQAVSCRVEFIDVNRDVETLHGVMRVRVVTFG